MRIYLAVSLSLLSLAPALLADSLVKNPSFENNYSDAFPHYGAIDAWSGGSGVNQNDGPFHNPGTPIPDQARAAFMQNGSTLGQTITGLTPGTQYAVQFFYDARNCCGGTINLATRFDGADLDQIVNVRPASGGSPYLFRNVLFTPANDSGALEFVTVSSGDATVDLDGVTIVHSEPGNVTVMNPSFEASGDNLAAPIYFGEGTNLAGWSGTGIYGVTQLASAGSPADNGVIPDQNTVAFLEGASSISQIVPNLIPGSNYQLSFFYNARAFDTPHLQVTIDGELQWEGDVMSGDTASPYHSTNLTFTATSNRMEIAIFQSGDGDQIALLDDIRLQGAAQEILPCLGLSPNVAELAPGQHVTVTVTVPEKLIAFQPATLKFHSGNAAVAALVGADPDGILSLDFAAGGTNVLTFDIQAVTRGSMRLEVPDSATLCVDQDLAVNVVTSFVRNPSFESTIAPSGIGIGEIVAWTGGSGLNTTAGPFQDNGTIPDRAQVAFIQGSKSLSQEIAGLTPGKHYWLQFRYNVRNCCGGTMGLAAR